MATCCLGLIVVWHAMTSAMLGQATPTSVSGDLAGVNPEWLVPMQQNIEEQVLLLSAAYDLDEASVKVLRDEMHRRLVEQVPLERAYQREKMEIAKSTRRRSKGIDPGGPVTADERAAYLLKLKNEVEAMPLFEKRVAEWLEQQLPRERVPEGRKRLEELWRRRDNMREMFIQDGNRRAGIKGAMMTEKAAEMAAASADGRPLPNGPKKADAVATAEQMVDAGRPVRPDSSLAQAPTAPKPLPKINPWQAAPEGQVPGSIEAGSPAARSPLPAAMLSQWDKYTISMADKHGFTEAQVAQARAILGNLRDRAERYRADHAKDYALAEMIGDAKARGERIAQLNRALDALFVELKVRLESLSTREEKEKAGAAVPSGGPPGARASGPLPGGPMNAPAAPVAPAEAKKGK